MLQTIELVVRDKDLTFADESQKGYFVSQNDDYTMRVDLDDRRTAMFAKFTADDQSMDCMIDEEGYILNERGERFLPLWALSKTVMTVGVFSGNYATTPLNYFVRRSIKDVAGEEEVQPDDPLVEQLIRMVNDVVAPEVEVLTDTEDEYVLQFTDKNGETVTPNLKGDRGEQGVQGERGLQGERGEKGDKGDTGDPFTYEDFTPQQLAAFKGEKGDTGDRGETGAKGDPFTYSDFTPAQLEALKGEKGDKGDKGDTGERGLQGIQGETGQKGDPFTYADFTQAQLDALKVKGDKGDPFVYTDFTPAQLESLRGAQGIQGERGEGFEIKKTYASIADMNADFNNPNLDEGDLVMIASDVSDPDNAKVYVKGESAFVLLVDLSGAQGIKGDQGIQGIQGERGLQGVGVASATVNEQDHLVLTLTDNTPIDAGYVKGAKGDKGDQGDAFTYADFTPAQLAALKGDKGDKGDTGAKGDAFTYADFTPEQIAALKGEKGDTGATGATGATGQTGATGATGNGISSATFDSSGNLTLHYTDGTDSAAFAVKGAKGDKGDTGATGATGAPGQDYVLTKADKDEIAALAAPLTLDLLAKAEEASY